MKGNNKKLKKDKNKKERKQDFPVVCCFRKQEVLFCGQKSNVLFVKLGNDGE